MDTVTPQDGLPIGRRVAYWRGRRRLSQQVFADRLGKSKSWVDKIERGVRRLDKFSVLHEIADVLQIDVQLLLGKAPQRVAVGSCGVDQGEVDDIRAALERYDSISLHFTTGQESPPLGELGKSVRHAWLTYQHARYPTLTRALPNLLRVAQTADTIHTAERTQHACDAAHLLGQVYQITSSTLGKLGEHDLAWLAADRALTVSQRADDPLLTGIAVTRVGNALLDLGRARPALEINLTTAHQLAPHPDPDTGDSARLSVYGTLLAQAAMAAARMGDHTTVQELLTEAHHAAEHVGPDQNHYWTSFGPTNLTLHHAATAVELGEGRHAIHLHENLPETELATLLPERRAHHLLDIARGYTQIGDLPQAGNTLVRADHLAPAEIRNRPLAHQVMTDLLRRTRNTPPPAIRELAAQMRAGI